MTVAHDFLVWGSLKRAKLGHAKCVDFGLKKVKIS